MQVANNNHIVCVCVCVCVCMRVQACMSVYLCGQVSVSKKNDHSSFEALAISNYCWKLDMAHKSGVDTICCKNKNKNLKQA